MDLTYCPHEKCIGAPMRPQGKTYDTVTGGGIAGHLKCAACGYERMGYSVDGKKSWHSTLEEATTARNKHT